MAKGKPNANQKGKNKTVLSSEAETMKKRRSTTGSSQKVKRTRNFENDKSDSQDINKNKEDEKELTDSSQVDKEKESESETQVLKEKERSRSRSRSRSADGVDHRPKSDEILKRSERSVSPDKQVKRKLSFKGGDRTPVGNKTPRKKNKRFSSRGGASNDEFSEDGERSEFDSEPDSSDQSFMDRSLSESESSLSEDERSFKRTRKGRIRSRTKSPKGKERERRSRSRSLSVPRKKRKRHKKHKRSRRGDDVQSIVDQALEKQRIQMEQYFAKLQNDSKRKQEGKNEMPVMKSPSDTDVYAPAVRRANDNVLNSPITKLVNQAARLNNGDTRGLHPVPGEDSINEFIQTMRNKLNIPGEEETAEMPPEDMGREPDAAAAAIIQAEKFRAKVEQPNGRFTNAVDSLEQTLIDDDDFVHVSCHVDKTNTDLIEKGQFVEMIKIKPKVAKVDGSIQNKIEIVNRDGQAFLVQGESSDGNKINNVRQWEQAFRVYAAIYSRANPTRAAEIWQYVEIINQAALTYTWENVATYDYHFRKMMAKNPQRSWAKIFHQHWNLDLKDYIPKHVGNNPKPHGSGRNNREICWRFNRGHCSYGTKCRFEHRCSYCYATSHGASTCRKKNKGKNNSGSGDRAKEDDHHRSETKRESKSSKDSKKD